MMWGGHQSGMHWGATGRSSRRTDAQSVLDHRSAEGDFDEDGYLRRTAALQQVGHSGITG
jgi:uncharacterized membrane protein